MCSFVVCMWETCEGVWKCLCLWLNMKEGAQFRVYAYEINLYACMPGRINIIKLNNMEIDLVVKDGGSLSLLGVHQNCFGA